MTVIRKAYADEWLAYYQYWTGSKIAKGPMKEAMIAELELHATEELNHSLLVPGRIIQLGGEPVVDSREGPGDQNIALQVLEQEVEHEEDLPSLLEDFELMINAMK